jgi:tetratricopeptide (TPR) repeat protein
MSSGRRWLPVALAACCAIAVPVARATDAAYDSGGTTATDNLLNDSFRAAHHGRYSAAIALDNKALAISPHFGRGYLARAGDYMSAGRYTEAAADLDQVSAMHPDDFTIQMKKAQLALYRDDPAGAIAILKIVVQMPLRFFWHDPYEASTYEYGAGNQYAATGHAPSHIMALSSIAEQMLHQDDAAIADMSRMVDNERQHPEYIMNFYCWNAAVSGLLESAELTCQNAIDSNSHDIGQYDSLGYVHLRMKAWDKAIADYNKALDSRSDLTTSLYGRGVARRARGDIAGGNADIAAATRDEPDIANIMQRLHAPGP